MYGDHGTCMHCVFIMSVIMAHTCSVIMCTCMYRGDACKTRFATSCWPPVGLKGCDAAYNFLHKPCVKQDACVSTFIQRQTSVRYGKPYIGRRRKGREGSVTGSVLLRQCHLYGRHTCRHISNSSVGSIVRCCIYRERSLCNLSSAWTSFGDTQATNTRWAELLVWRTHSLTSCGSR